MSDDRTDDNGLDAWFDAARRDAPEVPDALLRRVLDDARAVQRERVRTWPGPVASWRAALARAMAALGGVPAATGLAAAAMAGLWLGAWPPAALQTLGAGLLDGTAADTAYAIELMPGAEFDAPPPGDEEISDV